jgi:hypothetical protein
VLGGKSGARRRGGRRRRPRGRSAFPDVIAQASADKKPLLRKIAAVCGALGANAAYAEGIAKRHSGGVDRRLEMCSYEELYKIAQALVNTQRARQKGREVPA